MCDFPGGCPASWVAGVCREGVRLKCINANYAVDCLYVLSLSTAAHQTTFATLFQGITCGVWVVTINEELMNEYRQVCIIYGKYWKHQDLLSCNLVKNVVLVIWMKTVLGTSHPCVTDLLFSDTWMFISRVQVCGDSAMYLCQMRFLQTNCKRFPAVSKHSASRVQVGPLFSCHSSFQSLCLHHFLDEVLSSFRPSFSPVSCNFSLQNIICREHIHLCLFPHKSVGKGGESFPGPERGPQGGRQERGGELWGMERWGLRTGTLINTGEEKLGDEHNWLWRGESNGGHPQGGQWWADPSKNYRGEGKAEEWRCGTREYNATHCLSILLWTFWSDVTAQTLERVNQSNPKWEILHFPPSCLNFRWELEEMTVGRIQEEFSSSY